MANNVTVSFQIGKDIYDQYKEVAANYGQTVNQSLVHYMQYAVLTGKYGMPDMRNKSINSEQHCNAFKPEEPPEYFSETMLPEPILV